MDIPICYPGFSTIQPVASLNPHRRRVIEAGLGPTAKAGVSFFQGWAVKVRGGGGEWSKKTVHEKFHVSNILWIPFKVSFFFGGGKLLISESWTYAWVCCSVQHRDVGREPMWVFASLKSYPPGNCRISYPKKAFLSRLAFPGFPANGGRCGRSGWRVNIVHPFPRWI